MTNTTTPPDTTDDDPTAAATAAVKRLTELPKDGNRRVIDIDAARHARAETTGPPPVLKVGGYFYELPATMSAGFVTAIAEAGTFIDAQDVRMLTKFDEALEALLGADLWAELKADLDFADRMGVLEGALTVYELTLPESQASASSS